MSTGLYKSICKYRCLFFATAINFLVLGFNECYGQPAEEEIVENKNYELYGNIDAALYKNTFINEVDKGLKLNGQRESFFGIGTPEAEGGSTRFIGRAEVGFGSERGNISSDFSVYSRQIYAGLGGEWGQLLIGQQYNVMTNIGWSTLNPIDGGWGIYSSDPLYLGETFNYGNKSASSIASAGSNWFFGYLQQAVVYKFQKENYYLEFNYVPGAGPQGKGSSGGVGGSYQLGQVQLSAASMRQGAQDGGAYRQNYVYGGTWDLEDIKFYASKMQSRTSLGAAYSITYAGLGFKVAEDLQASMSYAYYQQNDLALYNGGSGNGLALSVVYSLFSNTVLYATVVGKKHVMGDDGTQAIYSTPAIEKSFLLGFSTAF